MSNFSFSHSVFKRLVSHGRQKASLCGNGLTLYQTTTSYTGPNRKYLQTTNDLEKEDIWKYCGKRRMLVTSFLLFQRGFLSYHIQLPQFKPFLNKPWFYMSAVQLFWKHCGKRWNCLQRLISPFPTVFSILTENFPSFSSNLKLSSANSFSLEVSNSSFGKGLSHI